MNLTLRLIQLLFLTAAVPFDLLCATPEISEKQLKDILRTLDNELEHRDDYIERRQNNIDSLSALVSSSGPSMELFMKLGRAYTTFNNDSAIIYFTRGLELAKENGSTDSITEFMLRRAPLLPQAGFISDGLTDHTSIDSTRLDHRLLRLYYSSGTQLYKYISSLYPSYPSITQHYDSVATIYQQRLANAIRHDTDLPQYFRALQIGEYFYMTGDSHKARAYLHEALEMSNPSHNSYAISASLLSKLALNDSLINDAIYYLALSAMADTRRATLEVTSLQQLGQLLAEQGDGERAHNYLYNALKSAVECRSTSRIIQTSQAMPVIESVHRQELYRSWDRIHVLIFLMSLCIIGLGAALIALRLQIKRQKKLRQTLEESNHIKEIYISRFLDLCSIYMDKIHQFCRIASSKISTGQTEELYRMTTSGKFVENQSAEFYTIFDDAFLHIYPEFIEKVNSLLKPECRYELRDGEKLNTDLRILAFMRLGIDDSARISHILNYSINTIYAYRNKIRNRAINRDTFEQDIAHL